mgnify:CR=1 FL=1
MMTYQLDELPTTHGVCNKHQFHIIPFSEVEVEVVCNASNATSINTPGKIL